MNCVPLAFQVSFEISVLSVYFILLIKPSALYDTLIIRRYV